MPPNLTAKPRQDAGPRLLCASRDQGGEQAGTRKEKSRYSAVLEDDEGAKGCWLEIRFPTKNMYWVFKDT